MRAHTRDESVHAHNTKSEVDIMRNGNQSRQLLSLARIFVLALCFTLVFAVAISVTPDGYFNSAKALNPDGDTSGLVRVYQMMHI